MTIFPRYDRLLLSLLALCANGCALQATSGPALSGETKAAAVVSTGITTQALRDSGAVFGLRAVSMFDKGLALRSGVAHAGYDWIWGTSRLALGAGLNLGAGSPVRSIPGFDGVGAYAGAEGNARVRLLGMGDKSPGFNLAYGFLELVLTHRSGGWVAGEGAPRAPLYYEGTFELGIRVGFGTDAVAAKKGIPPDAPTEGHATQQAKAEPR